MKRIFVIALILATALSAGTGLIEFGGGVLGSAVGGATSWGAYLLWSWGSKAITPDEWDPALEIAGQVGLYGAGYGVFIPVGAVTGVTSLGILNQDIRRNVGSYIGAYLGSAASVPFAVMVLDSLSWQRAALTAGSTILLPALGAWAGYRLSERIGETVEVGWLDNFMPYVSCDKDWVSAGFRMRF